MTDQGYVSTAASSKVKALPSVAERSAGNRLKSSLLVFTK